MVGFNNITAGLAQANIGKSANSASASISRLSSGNRIAAASDDVAGLSVGTALRTTVSTLKQALANAGQGTSLLQVADGALSQLVDIVTRQKAIAVQASSGQLDDVARGYLNQEFQGLASQVDQIAGSTNFNGVKLLNGGLGTTVKQAGLDTLAAQLTNAATQSTAGTAASSTTAVQAFFGLASVNGYAGNAGASAAGFANAGALNITDSGGTTLANGAYDTINGALYGQFSSFYLTNANYNATAANASATLNAVINGVTFSGSITGTSTSATLNNGSTYIKIGLGGTAGTPNAAASALSLSDAGAATQQIAFLTSSFADTYIQRTSVVQGVDFSGTALAGVTGGTAGIGTTRLNSANAVISNFAYAGNTGAANTSILTVQINGTTFTSQGVKDALAAGTLNFESADKQVFRLDLTGLPANTFTNIRTSATDQNKLISALNAGFSKAGSGLSFGVGSAATDTISITLGSVATSSIYGGQNLSVSTAANATAAQPAIDKALQLLTAARATVGAYESRFNFTSANLQTSIQNQDAARGTLLDTDVSSESTAYSTAQVQLQAGIATLAQANQLPQNLLKLLQ